MHVTTRRLFCRVVFLVLCVFPTLSVIAGIVAFQLPTYKASVQAALARRLGMSVSVDRISKPRPGLTRLVNLCVKAPENGTQVVHVGEVEVSARADITVVRLHRTRMDGANLRGLCLAIHNNLLCQPGNAGTPMRIVADNVRVYDAAGEWLYDQVVADYHGTEAQSRMTCTVHVRLRDTAELFTVIVDRNHASTLPTTSFSVDTQQCHVSCRHLVPLWPFLSEVGPVTTFQGRLWGMARTASGWQGEGSFQLSGMEIQPLMKHRWGHQLTGTCEVQCQQLRVINGQVKEFRGSLVLGEGVISDSLVRAAQQHLGAVRDESRYDLVNDGKLAFQALTVDIQLDGAGLELRGRRHGKYEDAILVDAGGNILLREPGSRYQPLPAMQLIRLIDPSNKYLVNATTETIGLLRLLPVPTATHY